MSDKIKNYKVRVIDNNNKSKNVIIDAPSFQEAKFKAMNEGSVLNVSRKRKFSFTLSLTESERIEFLSRLAVMLSSKIGVSQSLQSIEENYTGSIKKVAHRMRRDIESGDDLIESIHSFSGKVFPDLVKTIIQAGSYGGKMHTALNEAVEFEKELVLIKKNSGLGIYIAIGLFIFSALLVFGSALFLSPYIKGMSLIQQAEVDTSFFDGLASYTLYSMVFIFFLFFITFVLNYFIKPFLPALSDKILFKIPIFKDISLAKNFYISFFTFSKLVGSGLNILDSLKVTMESTKKGMLKNDFKNAYNALKKGEEVEWPRKLKSIHGTDRACLLVSTDKDDIRDILKSMSDFYREKYSIKLNKLKNILNSIAYMYLSLSAFIIFGQGMIPMLEAMNNLL